MSAKGLQVVATRRLGGICRSLSGASLKWKRRSHLSFKLLTLVSRVPPCLTVILKLPRLLLVLSAYFVAVTVRRSPGRAGAARWWWGRVARLLPPFLVATVVAWCALRVLAPEDWFQPNRGDLVVVCVDKHAAVMTELEGWSNQAQAGSGANPEALAADPDYAPSADG